MAQQHNRGSKAQRSGNFTPQGNSRRQRLAIQEASKKGGQKAKGDGGAKKK